MMLYGSGNRDPREFGDTADQLDVRREMRPPRVQQRPALLHRQPPGPAAGARRRRGAARRVPVPGGRPRPRRTPPVGVRARLVEPPGGSTSADETAHRDFDMTHLALWVLAIRIRPNSRAPKRPDMTLRGDPRLPTVAPPPHPAALTGVDVVEADPSDDVPRRRTTTGPTVDPSYENGDITRHP